MAPATAKKKKTNIPTKDASTSTKAAPSTKVRWTETPKKKDKKHTPMKKQKDDVVVRDLALNFAEALNLNEGGEDEILPYEVPFDGVWDVNKDGDYNHPNKATLEKINCIDVNDGQQQVDGYIFQYHINDINKKTQEASIVLCRDEDGRVGLGVATYSDWSRFEKDKPLIIKFQEAMFGKSKQRAHGMARIMRKLHMSGRFRYERWEFFELCPVDEEEGEQYTTKVFNEQGEPHRLVPCVVISKGSKFML